MYKEEKIFWGRAALRDTTNAMDCCLAKHRYYFDYCLPNAI
jgi:hypothetical protein